MLLEHCKKGLLSTSCLRKSTYTQTVVGKVAAQTQASFNGIRFCFHARKQRADSRSGRQIGIQLRSDVQVLRLQPCQTPQTVTNLWEKVILMCVWSRLIPQMHYYVCPVTSVYNRNRTSPSQSLSSSLRDTLGPAAPSPAEEPGPPCPIWAWSSLSHSPRRLRAEESTFSAESPSVKPSSSQPSTTIRVQSALLSTELATSSRACDRRASKNKKKDTTVQTFGAGKSVFKRSLLISARLHLFDQKYSIRYVIYIYKIYFIIF